jgi:hypothetical protein
MSTQRYQSINFKADSLALIETMNGIVDEYVAQGYVLTVRQLYYQLVARDVVENTERSYKRVTGIVNDAKMAGLMDWDAIEDRTREFIRRSRWSSGGDILRAVAGQFHMDMWEGQPRRAFVIVEKEALAGVLEPACRDLDVPLLAARGYPSGTVLRAFSKSDLLPCFDRKGRGWKQKPLIIHLGDHDPSGIDMSRDLANRLLTFITGSYSEDLLDEENFIRVALNMDQIEEESPPPNPAKTTDSRFASYRALHGDESWELDALKPEYLNRLVRERVNEIIDRDVWEKREREIEDVRERLQEVAEEFDS